MYRAPYCEADGHVMFCVYVYRSSIHDGIIISGNRVFVNLSYKESYAE